MQQLWLKNKFVEMFNLDRDKVVIALPKVSPIISFSESVELSQNFKYFIFPTFPRPFKNIELLCEAVKILNKKSLKFKVLITIDGSENKYSKFIFNKYKYLDNIEFIGLIRRDLVYDYYNKVDCLIFPSKLETWGLPISEFKHLNKPMLIADLPYANETVGDYPLVKFFNPSDSSQLASQMMDIINGPIKFDKRTKINYEQPFVESWDELFNTILN